MFLPFSLVIFLAFTCATGEQWDTVLFESTWVPYQILYQDVVLISPMTTIAPVHPDDCVENPFDRGYTLPLTVNLWSQSYMDAVVRVIIREKRMNVTQAYPLKAEVLRLVVRDPDFVNMSYKLSSGWVPINGFLPFYHTFYLSGLRAPMTNDTCFRLAENLLKSSFYNFFTLEVRLSKTASISMADSRNPVRVITHSDLLDTHVVRKSLEDASYPFIVRYSLINKWANEALDRSAVGVVINSLQRHELIGDLMAYLCRVRTTPRTFLRNNFNSEAQEETVYPPVERDSSAADELYCEFDESFKKHNVVLRYRPGEDPKKEMYFTLRKSM